MAVRGRSLSISDVAKRAGVSVRTVSRILSGYEGVRPETRAKVEQAMQELEYYPSAAARSLRGVKVGTIGVIGHNLTTTPHAFDIVAGIQAECERQDVIMMIGETSGRQETFDKLVERFRQQRADAIIFATDSLREVRIATPFSQCPLVLVNCLEIDGRYPAVIPDDIEGSYRAALKLLSLGHRRIAIVGLFEEMPARAMRDQGYRRALEEGGIVPDPALIRTGVFHDERDEFSGLLDLLEELFSIQDPPTAIMCGNDKMAMRAFFLLRRSMGKRIPEDVSVIGYDNYLMIAENLVPQLTTIALPYYEMGVRAAELALSGEPATGTHKVSGWLILRDSAVSVRS